MSRNTLRIIIILAAVSIAGIAVTQFYWVRKAFDLKENQFNRDVNASLQAVANRIFEINKTTVPTNSPVEQMSTNYFVVIVNGPVNANVLGLLIANEFEKRNITADYEYGVYDCEEQCMKGAVVESTRSKKLTASQTDLPTLKSDGYYFSVRFPSIEANLISQMGIWGFSSIVLVVVIFFFVYTLFVILRQKRLSEIQKDFINNMTHEFKTPLSTIGISSEVLKDPSIVQTPDRLLNYATIIQNESTRLKQHVERVLQIAKIEKDNVVMKKERLDAHEVIREAVQNSSVHLQEKNATIDLQLNAHQTQIIADRLHFTNIIFNLIDNALKYNKNIPHLKIMTGNSGNQFVVEVRDNGIGISAENHKKIFHQFYRVPTGNLHDVKGFGLGLSYVQRMIQSFKGKVTVESKLNEGSTFKILLPTA
ncbi:MAG: HAMP domain-containing histidine kinase [Bacteroidetes bacterium]|nr:HAMP domain-containing histidine kinase [Bacteroidota bacterium]MBS1540131.1 HAMP domain-containing histidine kinase [Bacteroidota bacterium]